MRSGDWRSTICRSGALWPAAPQRRAARRGGRQRLRQGRFVAPLLDHLICPLQERLRDRQAEGLRGLQIDHEVKLAGLLHRRSEEHTSELQSPDHLVCRLLLEKKKKKNINNKNEFNLVTVIV